MNRSSNATFLDGAGLEKSLRIVKNDAEEQLENFFGPVVEIAEDISNGRAKIVHPSPGFCIKAFKEGTQEKFFINVCQTDGIPPPPEISEDELIRILNDCDPDRFRIPMSITPPRETRDKSSHGCQVSDVAINAKFFTAKIEPGGLLREFLISVVFTGIESKYGVVLDERNFRILKNKRHIDKLIPHTVQNRDVKQVIESYPTRTAEDLAQLERLDNPQRPPGTAKAKPLIEEIDPGTMKTVKNDTNSTRSSGASSSSSSSSSYVPDPTKVAIAQAASKRPESKLFCEPAVGKPKRLIGEFHLPDCVSSSEITLDVGEDRILVEARKKGYLLDAFVNYNIAESEVEATFDTVTKILQVTMPLVTV